MKNRKMTKNLIIFSLLFFVLPFVSFAQIGVGNEAELGAVVVATTGTGADIEIDVDAGVEVDAGAEAGVRSETEVESETRAEERRSQAQSKATIKANSLGVVVTSSAQVNSEEDLEVFANNVSVEVDDVVSVSVSSDNGSRTVVVYNHKARLFGFIPVSVRSTTEVEAGAEGETEVRTSFPWWSFMARGAGEAKSDIETRIRNNADVRANVGVEASAFARARVAEAVIAELEFYTRAEASIRN